MIKKFKEKLSLFRKKYFMINKKSLSDFLNSGIKNEYELIEFLKILDKEQKLHYISEIFKKHILYLGDYEKIGKVLSKMSAKDREYSLKLLMEYIKAKFVYNKLQLIKELLKYDAGLVKPIVDTLFFSDPNYILKLMHSEYGDLTKKYVLHKYYDYLLDRFNKHDLNSTVYGKILLHFTRNPKLIISMMQNFSGEMKYLSKLDIFDVENYISENKYYFEIIVKHFPKEHLFLLKRYLNDLKDLTFDPNYKKLNPIYDSLLNIYNKYY